MASFRFVLFFTLLCVFALSLAAPAPQRPPRAGGDLKTAESYYGYGPYGYGFGYGYPYFGYGYGYGYGFGYPYYGGFYGGYGYGYPFYYF